MIYQPVEPAKDIPELRDQLIEACIEMSRLGFFIGTWGNISVRIEEGLLITPSAVDYNTMTREDLVVVSWDGDRISGTRSPSSEMQLHRTLLLRRPDLGAVLHSHSVYASACAVAGKTIPVTAEDIAQIIGGEVKCAPYIPGDRHVELAEGAWEAMGEYSAAVLLQNHGPVVAGRNISEAVIAARVLEKAAHIFILANSLGSVISIPEENVLNERDRFLYRYGKE